MQNVKIKAGNGQIVITIDAKQTGVPSKSGQSMVVASTRGNQPIDDGFGGKLGLTYYRPIEAPPES
jgi:hypothetical protein